MPGLVDINVRADVTRLTRDLTRFAEKQIPFATVTALNAIGAVVQEAEKENIKKVFPTATPFTVNSVGLQRANKGRLQVVIFVKDIATAYLEPFEKAGRHKLNSQALLNPKNIGLNQYGNLPKNKLASLRGRNDVFIGGVKGKNGSTINGVWQRVPARKGKAAGLKLLIRFGDALPVQQHLGYGVTARRTVGSKFDAVFGAAMTRALATAKS